MAEDYKQVRSQLNLLKKKVNCRNNPTTVNETVDKDSIAVPKIFSNKSAHTSEEASNFKNMFQSSSDIVFVKLQNSSIRPPPKLKMIDNFISDAVPSSIKKTEELVDIDVIEDKFLKSCIGSSGSTVQSTTTPRCAYLKWICNDCENECIPIVRESRCLCGHRLKEHKQNAKDPSKFTCQKSGCNCRHFFFLVAEGSWILRCRCKHKHTDHNCSISPFLCKTCKVGTCTGFMSPWVCNCGHAWSSHKQDTVFMPDTDTDKQQEEIELKKETSSKKSFYLRQDGIPQNEKSNPS